jgi:hypothetical protein
MMPEHVANVLNRAYPASTDDRAMEVYLRLLAELADDCLDRATAAESNVETARQHANLVGESSPHGARMTTAENASAS